MRDVEVLMVNSEWEWEPDADSLDKIELLSEMDDELESVLRGKL